MPNWKKEIKELAEDFYISQVKINRMLKMIENKYSSAKIPEFYNGNRDEYLYDIAQRQVKSMIFA